jgi:predicted ATP-grasp superfamily ATP-dependent carboligase
VAGAAARATVLVTDGEQRAALAAVRSLGAAGYEVLVASAAPRSIAGASRHARSQHRVPSALEQPAAFVDAIASLTRAHGVQVLLPMTEQSLLAVLDALDRFGGVAVPFADAEQFRRISDKALLLETARRVGIAVPEQHVLLAPEDGAALRARPLRFPLVLKPARSVVEEAGQRTKLGVRHAATMAELEARLAGYPASAYPIMLQQRIVGPGVGVFFLQWDGETIASFAHRRLREKPPAGGISVYREAIATDPALLAKSRRLLEAFDWRGVAMVEYKIDAATGTPYAMEVNGRFWGSLQLALDAGVDFPALLVGRALGQPLRGPERYRVGVRSRWEWGEIDHLLLRLRRSERDLALPPGSPGRLRTLLDVLTPWRHGDRLEMFRLADPKPFFRETLEWLRGR